VNVFSRKYHTQPFSLIPIVIRLHAKQSMIKHSIILNNKSYDFKFQFVSYTIQV